MSAEYAVGAAMGLLAAIVIMALMAAVIGCVDHLLPPEPAIVETVHDGGTRCICP